MRQTPLITLSISCLHWGGAKKLILELCYPVGSYFINDSANFNTVDKVKAYMGFGTWEAIEEGRFLEATRSTPTTRSAGLPNITGWLQAVILAKDNFGAGGALANTNLRLDYWDSNTGKDYQGKQYFIDFDASNSNSIYGSSSTVQPKSKTTYIYRRKA